MVEEDIIQSLVLKAKRGSSDAFGQLYDEFGQRIFNFLVARIKHRQSAEDLLHTVFLKAWNNIKTYTPRGAKFSTWLFQIANYTLIDHWRTKKNVVELDKVQNLSDFAIESKQYENYAYLWDNIETLPDDHKTVLILRFKEDLSITEISHVMGKTQVAVRVLQHRALKMLKSKLMNANYL